jgi:hypothetical protein
MFLHVLIKRDHTEAIQSDVDISSNQQSLCQTSCFWWPGLRNGAWQYPVLLKTRGSGNRNLRNKTVLRENSMICTHTFELFRRFEDGHISTESDERSGRPLSIRNNEAITKCMSWWQQIEDWPVGNRNVLPLVPDSLNYTFAWALCQRILVPGRRRTRRNFAAVFIQTPHFVSSSVVMHPRHGPVWLRLFSQIENTLQCKPFELVDAIKRNTTQQVLEILKTVWETLTAVEQPPG